VQNYYEYICIFWYDFIVLNTVFKLLSCYINVGIFYVALMILSDIEAPPCRENILIQKLDMFHFCVAVFELVTKIDLDATEAPPSEEIYFRLKDRPRFLFSILLTLCLYL
jgi:hypothetical protein